MDTLPLFNLITPPPLVLMLDDDEDDCVMLTHLVKDLFAQQVSLVCTINQADFLAHLASAESPVALIILDYHLPLATADELILYIRAQEGLKHVPIVVWSAQATAEQQQLCLTNGANDYLPKQAGVYKLSDQLDQLFRHYIPHLSRSA